jgi:hypothetical protein
MNDGFFPPPWNMNEHPEKTEGWIEFQKAMKKDPEYYNFDDMQLLQSMRLHDKCKCERCQKEVQLLENELARRNELER